MMIDEVSLGPAVILASAHLSSDLWLRSLSDILNDLAERIDQSKDC